MGRRSEGRKLTGGTERCAAATMTAALTTFIERGDLAIHFHFRASSLRIRGASLIVLFRQIFRELAILRFFIHLPTDTRHASGIHAGTFPSNALFSVLIFEKPISFLREVGLFSLYFDLPPSRNDLTLNSKRPVS